MSAEEIARVVADLREGRAKKPPGPTTEIYNAALRLVGLPQPVVDVTALYLERTTTMMDRDWQPYDEHPSIAPPWEDALFCYQNKHGNVVTGSMHAWEPERTSEPWWGTVNEADIDWSLMRWRVLFFFWMGGKTQGTIRTVTAGPTWMFEVAVEDTGKPHDMHWTQLYSGTSPEEMQVPQFVVLDALNFLNCRNIEIVEPTRRNFERKRIAKTGVTINELHVFPSGKTSRSAGVKGEPLGSAHAPVRGHFAEYGERYGKGKLFGKLEGRFYIPPHVRGSKDMGESQQEFTLRTD